MPALGHLSLSPRSIYARARIDGLGGWFLINPMPESSGSGHCRGSMSLRGHVSRRRPRQCPRSRSKGFELEFHSFRVVALRLGRLPPRIGTASLSSGVAVWRFGCVPVQAPVRALTGGSCGASWRPEKRRFFASSLVGINLIVCSDASGLQERGRAVGLRNMDFQFACERMSVSDPESSFRHRPAVSSRIASSEQADTHMEVGLGQGITAAFAVDLLLRALSAWRPDRPLPQRKRLLTPGRHRSHRCPCLRLLIPIGSLGARGGGCGWKTRF